MKRTIEDIQIDLRAAKAHVTEAETEAYKRRCLVRSLERELARHPVTKKAAADRELLELKKNLPSVLFEELVQKGVRKYGKLVKFRAFQDTGADYPLVWLRIEFTFSKSGMHAFISDEWNVSVDEQFETELMLNGNNIQTITVPDDETPGCATLWKDALQVNKGDVPRALVALYLLAIGGEEPEWIGFDASNMTFLECFEPDE